MAQYPCFNYKEGGAGAIILNEQGAGAGAARNLLEFQKSSAQVIDVPSIGLIDPGGGFAKRSVTVFVGDIVAESDLIEKYLCKFDKDVVITKISINVDTDTADGGTNKQTISVKRSTDSAEVVGYTTSASNPGVSQDAWQDLGALGNTAIAATKYLYVDFTKVVAGLVISGLTFQIEYTLVA